MVYSEADLRGEGHEAHLRQSSRRCALLVHCDGSLVFELWRENVGRECQTLLLRPSIRMMGCEGKNNQT